MRLTWHNRGHRKFRHGIAWFRECRTGWGLWWKDTRIAPPNRRDDAPGLKLRVGPFLVKVLTPRGR